MGEEIAISLSNVSKCFKRYARPVDRLKEIILPSKNYSDDFWALREISLEIFKGETMGILGRNGSGKSTLLQIIAKTLTPTIGRVSVNGRVSALLELGSGFNPEFTGRQNVFFNGQILGLKQKEVENKFDEIAAFADIGDFIDEPVKTYSSGMFVRLAFAVAINVNPKILIVDEALSVGDGVFVHRCMAKIKEFQDSNGTIIFVSHDIGSVSRLCSKVVWINEGEIVEVGQPFDICRHYQAWIYKKINENSQNEISHQRELSAEHKDKSIEDINANNVNVNGSMLRPCNPFTQLPHRNFANVERFGTGKAEIVDFKILDKNGKPLDLAYPGNLISIRLSILAHSKIEKPIIGCTIYDRLRTAITAWNTYQMSIEIRSLELHELLDINFEFVWPALNSGNYLIKPAVADGTQDSHEMLDWLQCAAVINSSVTDITLGIFKLSGINTVVGYS
jgi:lipopolysaccharide transport system ATP-binding protein